MDAPRRVSRNLNTGARIIEKNNAVAATVTILGAGLFEFQMAHQHPMWTRALYALADHAPETEAYGVASYVCGARKPFAPDKIRAALNASTPDLPDPLAQWRGQGTAA